MYLALFLVAMLYWGVYKEKKDSLFFYGVVGAILVLLPVTQLILELYFQGFYSADAYTWLLPVLGVIAFVVMEIYDKQWKKAQKRALLPLVCLLFVLCGILSQEYVAEANADIKKRTKEVYELVLEQAGEREIVLVAPRELMETARAYDARFVTAYGRDVWEQELDYAFYDGYDSWVYELADCMEKPLEENREQLLKALQQSGANFVVFDKENLTYGESMQYPDTLNYNGMSLRRLDETRYFVIYTR